MTSPDTASRKLGLTEWLVLVIASIGFLFDTYVLLMTPLVGVPAIAELLQLPANHPTVTDWMGRMLWMTALSGGVFGLLGGWLIDRFGRKRIMAIAIFFYAFSPFASAFVTTLPMFVFYRCTTFIGVCVEFVAAITWLAELFPDKRRKELALGTTQAFASLGGLLVTGINVWVISHANSLPALPLPEMFNAHASWRYTLMSGLLPAIPIALLLPFVPESQVWRERKAAGTLKRPSFAELFSPQLRRVTLVTAGLSACAYAAAFGALQLTPLRVAPGLPQLADQRKELKPLQDEARQLNAQVDAVMPAFRQAEKDVPGLIDLAGQRSKNRVAFRAANNAGAKETADALNAEFKQLGAKLDEITASKPDAKMAVIEREKILRALGDNRDKQEPLNKLVKERGNSIQMLQETGGLIGRIVLAGLLLTAIPRGRMLRMFLLPGIVLFAVTYTSLYSVGGAGFQAGIFFCGFLVVAQFSYFGEYLPKIFPMHLRGTGGSFATNVGGRMIGTSAAFLTTTIASHLSGPSTFNNVAFAAAIVGTSVFVIGFALSFLLPEPKEQKE
ncbi:MAG: MFS transporter [Verrucomicrobia bacterium]|nr:MFS transporter [Verrucomicrobiota bacterium]